MTDLTRQQILDKYPAINWRPMDPALNTTVQAVLDAERIENGLADDALHNSAWFDPGFCPTLHAKLMAELEALHALEREGGGAEYITFRGETYDPHDPTSTSGTVLVKLPFCNSIFVCRNNADRMTAVMRLRGPWPTCDVCIADDCSSCVFIDYPTKLLPIACGRVVLMFEICRACEFVADDTAFYGVRSAVLDAQAKLPPGAVIDPRSPIPPRP